MAEEAKKSALAWDPDRPTQVTCPACEALGGAMQSRCSCCRGAGFVTAAVRREWLKTNPPDKRPAVCPGCNHTGVVLEELGGRSYRTTPCPCCRGAGVVSVARAREWRIAHAVGRPNE